MNAQQLNDWLVHSQSASSATFQRPLIMGILNITPDSFSDGGCFYSVDKALKQALLLSAQGADLIDIGGESTKPGAQEVSIAEEIDRVIPVIEKIREHSDVSISIDTYKPQVMEAAVAAGANFINDIYALRQEGALAMAARLSVPVCLMHMQGKPQTMQVNPDYPAGVVNEVLSFFQERLFACEQAGIARTQLIFDPGFGFGKHNNHNLMLLKELQQLKLASLPLLLGVSRKNTLGAVLDRPVNERLLGSLAVAVYASLKGINVLRVHDVEETQQVLQVMHAIYHGIAH